MHHVRRTFMAFVLIAVASAGVAQAKGVADLLAMSPAWEAFYNAADLDGTLAAEGKYLIVYRFVDGAWRIARHM